MFDFLFGWRKASKCKKVIKLAQCRLKLLKNKRQAIVKQLRQDTAHLVKTGYQNIAFHRAEQLIRDETVMEAYDLLDRFCEFILRNFSNIQKLKECPDDINEAVSSLVFASARCGDLPELRVIRKIFENRYGKNFVMAAVELLPGNLVNRKVKETLSMKTVSDEMKRKTVNEIAEDYCLPKPEVLALEYDPEWQQQEQQKKESSEHKVLAKGVQTSNAEIEEQGMLVDSSSTGTNFSSEPRSTSASDSTATDQQALSNSCDQSCNEKHESWTKNSTSKGSRRSYIESRKRSRRRLSYQENQSPKDIEYLSYYGQPRKKTFTHKHRSHQQRRQQNKTLVEEGEGRPSYDAENKKFCCREIRVNPSAGNRRYYPQRPCCRCCCNHENLCYFSTDEDNKESEVVTVPRERWKDDFQRVNSRLVRYPSHVHPKLPNYDDLAAIFGALKAEKMLIKHRIFIEQ